MPVWKRKDPLDELMVTLLSQNTNDTNRDRAYFRLRERFSAGERRLQSAKTHADTNPSEEPPLTPPLLRRGGRRLNSAPLKSTLWERVLAADVQDIEDAIRPAGLAPSKSVRMKELLVWIKETFGSLSLESLRSMDDDAVMELLTSRKGVGVKTAAVLLAFSLDRDLCPVDTHVHRIARRLGWVPEGTSAENTFHTIRPFMPKGRASTFHLNLLKFGRTRCTARNPKCSGCPLWKDCVWEGKSD